MTDPISDMLTRIRNANGAMIPAVEVPHSRLKERLAAILQKEGYIAQYSIDGDKIKTIKIKLKYEGRKSVIEGLRRISRPGRRVYAGSLDIPRVRGDLGVSILSTSQGIMTGKDARKNKLGGEILCFIW